MKYMHVYDFLFTQRILNKHTMSLSRVRADSERGEAKDKSEQLFYTTIKTL